MKITSATHLDVLIPVPELCLSVKGLTRLIPVLSEALKLDLQWQPAETALQSALFVKLFWNPMVKPYRLSESGCDINKMLQQSMPGLRRTGLLDDAAQVALLSFEPNLSKSVFKVAPGLSNGLTAILRVPGCTSSIDSLACRV